MRPAVRVLAAVAVLAGAFALVPERADAAAVGRAADASACGGPCVLSVSLVGSGSGSVTSRPAGIQCPTACWSPVEPGWVVTLTAAPAPGSWLSRWTGCDEETATTCTVTIPISNVLVGAVFDVVGGPPTATPPPPAPPPGSSPPAPPATPAGRCTLVGTEGDDDLVGTPGNDVICALGGDDHIHAGGGDDVVYGGPGNDEIELQGGNDRGYGGPGDDLIEGGSGNDVLAGGPGRDLIRGGSGNDRIVGGGGRDRLYGGPGRDDLRARDGFADLVHGGPGRDTARVDARDVLRAVERRLR